MAKNADLRSTRQTEAALAVLVFSTLEEFVGVDLTDTEEGSHLLPEPLIVDPDSNLDSQEPPLANGQKNTLDASQDNEMPKANKNRKAMILQFHTKDEHS